MASTYTNPYLQLNTPGGNLFAPDATPEQIADALARLKGGRIPVPAAVPGGQSATPRGGATGDRMPTPEQSPDESRSGANPSAPRPNKATTAAAGSTTPSGQVTQVNPQTGQPIPPLSDPTSSSTATAVAPYDEDAEVARRIKLFQGLQPHTDYFAEAQHRLGPEPGIAPAVNPKTAAIAALVPALAGLAMGGGTRSFASVPYVLGGFQSGQVQRGQADVAAQTDYRNRAAALATSLEANDTRNVHDIAPYVMSTVHQEQQDQEAQVRDRIAQDRWQGTQRYQEESLALRAFQWANPSANAQLSAQEQGLRLKETELHNQIDEALAQHRLDQVTGYENQLVGLRQQELQIHRTAVDAVVQRSKTATKDQTLTSIEGVQRLIDSITTELGTVTMSPSEQAMLHDQLTYYQSAMQTLQTRAQTAPAGSANAGQPTGMPAPTPPRAAPGKATAIYQRWVQLGKQPIPAADWNRIDPGDQQQLTQQGVTHL